MNFMIPYSNAIIDGMMDFMFSSCRRYTVVDIRPTSFCGIFGENAWKIVQKKALEADKKCGKEPRQ